MKYLTIFLILIWSGISSAINYNDYRIISLESFHKSYHQEPVPGDTEEKVFNNLNTQMRPFSSFAYYTGNKRVIPAWKQKFLDSIITALPQSRGFISTYKEEVEVEAEGRKFWIPLQNTFTEAFVGEVLSGGLVQLYLRHAGSVKTSGTLEYKDIYLCTEFSSLYLPKRKEQGSVFNYPSKIKFSSKVTKAPTITVDQEQPLKSLSALYKANIKKNRMYGKPPHAIKAAVCKEKEGKAKVYHFKTIWKSNKNKLVPFITQTLMVSEDGKIISTGSGAPEHDGIGEGDCSFGYNNPFEFVSEMKFDVRSLERVN